MRECFQCSIAKAIILSNMHSKAHIFASKDMHEQCILALDKFIVICYASNTIT